jgi:hypothetical protein
MARVTSLIKFQGTIDGVTITKDGVVKQAPKSRPITASRSKENNNEFAIAAKQGKVIRDAVRVLNVADKNLSSRMLQAVRSGIALDNTNERGKRILSNNEAKTVLKGFEMNRNANLQSVAPIRLSFVVEPTQTTFNLKSLTDGDVILKDLSSPEGTTHAAIVAIAATLDITPEVLLLKEVNVVQSDTATKDEVITLSVLDYTAPAGNDMIIIALAIKFYQEVNGQFYDLQNGAYDVAKILDIYFEAPVVP